MRLDPNRTGGGRTPFVPRCIRSAASASSLCFRCQFPCKANNINRCASARTDTERHSVLRARTPIAKRKDTRHRFRAQVGISHPGAVLSAAWRLPLGGHPPTPVPQGAAGSGWLRNREHVGTALHMTGFPIPRRGKGPSMGVEPLTKGIIFGTAAVGNFVCTARHLESNLRGSVEEYGASAGFAALRRWQSS